MINAVYCFNMENNFFLGIAVKKELILWIILAVITYTFFQHFLERKSQNNRK